jgi:LPXTG-motif cell wall-anchored protein
VISASASAGVLVILGAAFWFYKKRRSNSQTTHPMTLGNRDSKKEAIAF